MIRVKIYAIENVFRVLYQAMQTQEKSFLLFLKTTRWEKIKKIILLIKIYLPTSLIWQWNFSTDQWKLTFWKSGGGVLLVYIYVTQPCLHTLVQTRLSANQSARTIVILWNIYDEETLKKPGVLHKVRFPLKTERIE